jgi:hypothetical protein
MQKPYSQKFTLFVTPFFLDLNLCTKISLDLKALKSVSNNGKFFLDRKRL